MARIHSLTFTLVTFSSLLSPVVAKAALPTIVGGYEIPPIPTVYPPPETLVPTSTANGNGLTSTKPVDTGNGCTTPPASVIVLTSLHVSTVSYVTTSTQRITTTATPAYVCIPTCVAGTPIATGGYTITYRPVRPTPYLSNYLPDLDWEIGSGKHLIGSEEFYFGSEYQTYAEFKCQFQCKTGCSSWYVAYNITGKNWKCLQYNAIITPPILIPPPADVSFVSGAAFNAICGQKPTLTPPVSDPIPTSSQGGLTSTKPTSVSTTYVLPSPPTLPPYLPPIPTTLVTMPTQTGGGLTNTKPTTPYIPTVSILTLPPAVSTVIPTSSRGGLTNTKPTTLPTLSIPGYEPPNLPTSSAGGLISTKPTTPIIFPPVYTPPNVPTSSAGGLTNTKPTTYISTAVPPVYTPPAYISPVVPTSSAGGLTNTKPTATKVPTLQPPGYSVPTLPPLPPPVTTKKPGPIWPPIPTFPPWPFPPVPTYHKRGVEVQKREA
ncbi:hypothetical protein B0O99DRAFT_686514 [Bisporella sp. PMI_857]|nr:hypothetical protein B0O99DRAFT_686514 [Bisporella sp. PMI_857]